MQDIKYNHLSEQQQVEKRDFKIFQVNAGLTQVDIANEIGCSQPFLSMLLSGKRHSKEYKNRLLNFIKANSQQVN